MRRASSFAVLIGLFAVACSGSSSEGDKDDDTKKGTPLDDKAVHQAIDQHKNNPPTTQVTKLLAVGAKAPEFSSEAHTGKVITLSELKGKKVVLYFYPKDFTGG